MPTFAEIQRERKSVVREIRRTQRAMDTRIERLERTLFRLLDRKTLLSAKDALRIAQDWNNVLDAGRGLEAKIRDAMMIFVEVG